MLSPAAAAGSVRRLTRRRGNGTGRRLDECALLFAEANTLCSNTPPHLNTGVLMLQSVGEVFKVSMRVCVGARYVERKKKEMTGASVSFQSISLLFTSAVTLLDGQEVKVG